MEKLQHFGQPNISASLCHNPLHSGLTFPKDHSRTSSLECLTSITSSLCCKQKQSLNLRPLSKTELPFQFLTFINDGGGLVAELCPTLCDPMNRSMPGLPVHHHLLEFTQTHVHRVGDAIQPYHPLSSPSHPAVNPSQHQGLVQ